MLERGRERERRRKKKLSDIESVGQKKVAPLYYYIWLIIIAHSLNGLFTFSTNSISLQSRRGICANTRRTEYSSVHFKCDRNTTIYHDLKPTFRIGSDKSSASNMIDREHTLNEPRFFLEGEWRNNSQQWWVQMGHRH